MKILYVEDEEYLAEAVIHLLAKANITADWTADGREGLDRALKNDYDAIVLDIMLPGMSGLDILSTIRKRHIHTPIIMLSALSQVEDKVRGLEFGADDYLAKPFKTAELIARLEALARRPAALEEEKLITFGDLKFDPGDRTVNGVALTEKESELLDELLRDPGRVHAKDHLLFRVWGTEAQPTDNYVEVYISFLRKKLKSINSKVQIKSVRGLGYRLIMPASKDAKKN